MWLWYSTSTLTSLLLYHINVSVCQWPMRQLTWCEVHSAHLGKSIDGWLTQQLHIHEFYIHNESQLQSTGPWAFSSAGNGRTCDCNIWSVTLLFRLLTEIYGREMEENVAAWSPLNIEAYHWPWEQYVWNKNTIMSTQKVHLAFWKQTISPVSDH